MKICRITTTFLREEAPGAGLPSFNLTKYINEPTLVLTKKRNGTIVKSREGAKVIEISYFDPPLPQIPEKRNFLFRLYYMSVMLLKFIGNMVFFIKSIPHLIRYKPQIVHVHAIRPLLQGLFAKTFLSSKLVVSLHGSEVLKLKNNILFQRMLRFADLVLYVSKSMEELLFKILPQKKLVYFGNGVDLDMFKYDGKKRNQIVAVGRWRWQKGPQTMMEALQNTLADFKDYRAVICGDGPLLGNMKKEVKDTEIENRLKFSGTLPQKEVANLLKESKLLIMTSVSEGFPKVILEAIASQTPIVATDVGSCKEVVEGEVVGIVVKPGDVQGIKDAIFRILKNEQIWLSFFENCKRARNKYSWDSVAQRVYSAYKELTY